VDALIAAVRDSNVEVRRRAVSALGEIGDSRALPALTAALKDEDAGVRRQAVMAIAEISDEDDNHPSLTQHIRIHPKPRPHPKPVIAGIR
jgi:HEAT repeat protein